MLATDFACGYQWYRDSLSGAVEAVPRIVVTVIVDDQEVAALVDTGANQLLLEWSIARPLVDAADLGSIQVRALGGRVHQGVMFPVTVSFLADEGLPVSIETAAWSAESFDGPNLIGYGGLLEKLRFAVDPETNRFFFGS